MERRHGLQIDSCMLSRVVLGDGRSDSTGSGSKMA